MKARYSFVMLFVFSMSFLIFSFRNISNLKESKNIKKEFAENGNTKFQPTEGTEDESLRRKKIDEWIEQMHSAAPGVNWRKIDQRYRDSRKEEYELKMQTSSNLDKKLNLAKGTITGTWKEVGSENIAGRVDIADYDVTTKFLYIFTAGGHLWKGNLDGTSWQSVNDQFRITNAKAFRILKNGNSTRFFALQNIPAAAYYSDDSGLNWTKSVGLPTYAPAKKAVVTTDNTIFVLTTDYDGNFGSSVYRSTDMGYSFQKIKQFYVDISQCDLWCDKYSVSPVFLLAGNSIYTYNNNNFQLTASLSNYPASPAEAVLTGTFLNQVKVLYIAASQNNSTTIYYSGDGGFNWQMKTTVITGEQIHDYNSFQVSNTDPNKLFLGGVECWKSIDGALNWNKVNSWGDYYGNPQKLHADINGIYSLKDEFNNEIYFVCTDGGLYLSRDNLVTTINLSLKGLMNCQYYSVLTNKNNYSSIYTGSQDQGIQRSKINSSPRDFEQITSGDYGHLTSGDNGTSLWCVYPGFVWYSPNVDVASQYHYDFNMSGNLWMPPLAAIPNSNNKAYLGGGSSSGGAKLWKLQFNGNSITSEEKPFDFSEGINNISISAVAVSPIDNNYLYVSTTNGQFFSSTDDGQSWVKSNNFSGPPSHYFYGNTIVPSPQYLGTVYIGGSGYSNPAVYQSTNNGLGFSPMNSGLPQTLVFELAITPDSKTLYAATENGPFAYSSSLNQWFNLNNFTVPDERYWGVEYIPKLKTARFASYGRGVWDFIEQNSAVVLTPTGGELLISGTYETITWFSNGIQTVKLEFSSDNGNSWNLIGNVSASANSFNWVVPYISSALCKIRISDANDGSVFDESYQVFSIGNKLSFNDFSSISSLTLVGSAQQNQSVLRLTSNGPYQTGAFWYQNKLPIALGFLTTFQFKLTDLVNSGADGLAFVLHNTPNTTMGSSQGYGGIPNSLAIEFDTYYNPENGDPNNNHISVHTKGLNANSVDETSAGLGMTTAIPNMKDGNIHTVKVLYKESGTLTVNFDSVDVLSVQVQLDKILNLDNGMGWVGYTASTGWAAENHDLISWIYEGHQITDNVGDKSSKLISYTLQQNYPNPFNPSTTINYSIPESGNVKLTIYNAVGSRIATIVDEHKPAGNYSVKFKGSNLASGIYLYRLESGNYSAAKKFILMK